MWIITRDHISDDAPNRVGAHSADYDETKFATRPQLDIRLLDDDGEVYYEGRATEKRILDSSEIRAFDVLDWAMNDAGCTELQYRKGSGPWETL